MKLHLKNLLFYFVMLALLAMVFFIFRSAYTNLVLQKQLAERDNTVYAQFQHLSEQVNSAAIITPELLRSISSSKANTLFYIDSANITAQLQHLKAIVTDPLTIKITLRLDTLVRSELSWLLASNVPDSMLHHRSPQHINAIENIHTLIGQALARKNILINQHTKQLNDAILKVKTWMIIFIALASLLLFYSVVKLVKQKSSSERKFRALVENSDDLIAMLDRNMRPIYQSPSVERLTAFGIVNKGGGIKMEEVHDDDKNQLAQSLEQVQKNPGKAIYATYRAKHGKGHYIWLEGTFTNLFADPDINAIVVNMRDITQRKHAEIQLQQTIKQYEDYKFALDESSIIAITDNKGIIQSVNDNFCKISQYNREELIGKTHRLINSGFHPPAFFINLWQTISSGKTWRGEIKNKTKQGDDYWVYTTITPFIGSDGKPFQYLAIRFDITEKKLAEEAALNTLLEKNIILESIGDAFIAIDKNWIVTYWNRQAEKMLSIQSNQVLGKNLWEIFPESINSTSYHMYHTALATGTVMHFENYSQYREKWFEISAYPSPTGLSVYFKDITDRKISELQLQQLNQNLQQQAKELSVSNTELEQFAYVASHDLQEPLRMVTSFLTQLEKKYSSLLDERGKKYIDFAVDGAKRMRQLILDLLEFSRAGRMEYAEEDIELNVLINEIKILYRKQIEEKDATITVSQLPIIKGYKVPLRQVFQNLLGNALKYTAQNRQCKITIDCMELTAHWQFNITDNGIGIEEEFFNRIFIIFQRLHNNDAYSGTGMGLAVTKKIVENFGGKIWLTSEPDKGSTFSFTLLKDNT